MFVKADKSASDFTKSLKCRNNKWLRRAPRACAIDWEQGHYTVSIGATILLSRRLLFGHWLVVKRSIDRKRP